MDWSVSVSLSDAPKVRLTPVGPLRVRVGDPVSVECRAQGRPRPTLLWKRQGSTLQLVTTETDDVITIQVRYWLCFILLFLTFQYTT